MKQEYVNLHHREVDLSRPEKVDSQPKMNFLWTFNSDIFSTKYFK